MLRPLFFLSGFLLTIGLTAQSTFVQVYDILQENCTVCHGGANPEAGLNLRGEGATLSERQSHVFNQLVSVSPQNSAARASGDDRIYPGRLDKSYLFRKINRGLDETVALGGGEGGFMPPYGSGFELDDVEKEMVRQWVLYGAPRNGEVVERELIESFYNEGGLKSYPDGPPPAPLPSEGFQIKMGPFYLPPGGEVEYFQKWELELKENADITRLDINISNYSHHFLLYNFENNANQVPSGLRLSQNHTDIGLVAAVAERQDVVLPQGTAFKWDKDLVLDLNSHYINYSSTQPYQAEVYLNIYTEKEGTAAQEMISQLIPNIAINIPNDGTPRTFQSPIFNPFGDEIFIWAMGGHTHKYGTDFKVYHRNFNGSKGDLIYDGSCPEGIPGCVSPFFDYQHIPFRVFDPLYPVKLTSGLIQEATYVNDGDKTVRWGPTSDDEMMLVIVMFTEDTAGVVSATKPLSSRNNMELANWPNPVYDEWNVSWPWAANAVQYKIYRLDGTTIMAGTANSTETISIPMAELPTGHYLYHLIDDRGRFGSGKLVKY